MWVIGGHGDIIALAFEVHYLVFLLEESRKSILRNEYGFLKSIRDRREIIISSSNSRTFSVPKADNLQVKVRVFVFKAHLKEKEVNHVDNCI